jgi:hypothetical protein
MTVGDELADEDDSLLLNELVINDRFINTDDRRQISSCPCRLIIDVVNVDT